MFLRFGVSPPKGVLLHGPTGTGKTHMALAVARIVQERGLANVMQVQSSDLIGSLVGSSEAAVASMFERARQLAPCLLILDNFEVLAQRRVYAPTPTPTPTPIPKAGSTASKSRGGGKGTATGGDDGAAPPPAASQPADSSHQALDRLLSVMLTEMDGVLSSSSSPVPVPVPVPMAAPTGRWGGGGNGSGSGSAGGGGTGGRGASASASGAVDAFRSWLADVGLEDCVTFIDPPATAAATATGSETGGASAGRSGPVPIDPSERPALDASTVLQHALLPAPSHTSTPPSSVMPAPRPTAHAGVMVLAITRHVGQLDPAIMRPGRLDVHLATALPTPGERAQLLTSFFARSPLAPLLPGDEAALRGRLSLPPAVDDGAETRAFLSAAHAEPGTVDGRWARILTSIAHHLMAGWSPSRIKGLWEESASACLRRSGIFTGAASPACDAGGGAGGAAGSDNEFTGLSIAAEDVGDAWATLAAHRE